MDCVNKLINKSGKKITGLLTVVKLIELKDISRFNFPVDWLLSI